MKQIKTKILKKGNSNLKSGRASPSIVSTMILDKASSYNVLNNVIASTKFDKNKNKDHPFKDHEFKSFG